MLKKVIIVVAGLIVVCASSLEFARAQDSTGPGEGARAARTPEDVVAMLDSKLSLSEDQKAKITPIIAERQQKIREFAGSPGRRMQKARQMKTIFEESDKKIMAVLNDDQKRKYSEIEKQMREHAKQRRHDRGNDSPQ